ncbi:MAG: DNA ligase [Sulfurimonadaceae bacterium]
MKPFISLLSILFTLYASPNSSLQHAKIYTDQNISGWVMSEKLDGIRGYWDGKAMYSKNSKKLFTPKGFTKNFPSFALDGELWSRHQDFEAVQSKVLKHNGTWEGISYNIFEVPHAKGDFFSRIDKAKQWFKDHPNPYVQIIPQYTCQNTQDLDQYLDEVISSGGEGVMVKNPQLSYISGRTSSILKVKIAHDMEGKVIAVTIPSGSDRMKSLTLELGNGIRFKLGNGYSEHQRLNPPVIGSLVTFKYYGFTKKGKPKFASFIHYRID